METGTIFALATAPVRSAIAVIRVSGPGAGPALVTLTGRAQLRPRQAVRADLRDPVTGEGLDKGVVLWFPGPSSYTGEDIAEFQIHGGRAVIDGVLGALAQLPGLRPAEPGEFTRRAFEFGKLDLTEAEAVADIIDATTAVQRRQALGQLGGQLAQLYEGWRQRLVRVLAHLEAGIDFSDDDLPMGLDDGARRSLEMLVSEFDRHLADGRRGERVREGVAVAIIGPPNAGKSSLLNCLAQRDAAIVSAQSGTTRDVIEVGLDLGGFPVTLVDTAGLRESADEVESEGIRRAYARARASDIKVAVFDGAALPAVDPLTVALIDDNTLIVVNKSDRFGGIAPVIGGRRALAVSVHSGFGIVELMTRITEWVAARLDTAGLPTMTRLRHRVAVTEARDAVRRALAAPLSELVAEDVRLATRGLGRITGRVTVEEVLDVIFKDFCIGK